MRVLYLAILVGLCACSKGQPELSPIPSGGEAVAARLCSGCHAIDPISHSPRAAAPTFRDLALRYNEISLERKLTEISGKPHFEMPPVALQNTEINDLATYIARLR